MSLGSKSVFWRIALCCGLGSAGVTGQQVLQQLSIPGFDGTAATLVSLGDADLDGADDIAVAAVAPLAEMRAYSARTGALVRRWLPPVPAGTRIDRLIAAGDADADGTGDVWVEAAGTLWCYSVSRALVLHTLGAAPLLDAGQDFDGDGHDDLLCAASMGSDWQVVSGRTGAVVHTANAPGTVLAAAFCGDVDADGRADVSLSWADASNATAAIDLHSGVTGASLRSHSQHVAAPASVVGAMGDLDGDGLDDDFAFHQQEFGPPPASAGYLRVYSGQTGALIASWNGTGSCTTCGVARVLTGVAAIGRFAGNGEPRPLLTAAGSVWLPLFKTFLGSYVDGAAFVASSAAAVADVDRDGFDDVALGTPGAIEIVSLRSGLETSSPSSRTGATLALESVGDVNGDGIGDYARGELRFDPLRGHEAVLSVHDGGDGRLLFAPRTPSSSSGFMSISPAGDVDGDGRVDVAVGAGGGGSGRVSIYGAGGARLLDVTNANTAFGRHIAAGTDWDADGVPDVVVSVGPSTLILSGRTGIPLAPVWPAVTAHLLSVGDLDGDGEREVMLDGAVYSSALGSVLFTLPATNGYADAGDRTGDGVADLWAARPGMLELISGATGTVARSLPTWPGGTELATGADWDGDGTDDFAASDPATNQVWVLSGTDASTVLFSARNGGPGDAFGRHLALMRVPSAGGATVAAAAPVGGPWNAGYVNLYRDPTANAAVTTFGVACGVGRGPLRASWTGGRPVLGRAGAFTLGPTARNVPAVALLGVSDATWSGASLPVALRPMGFGGCALHVAPLLELPTRTASVGATSWAVPLPFNPTFVGWQVYLQAAVSDVAAPGGWAFSSATRLRLGSR